jgi:hypothetical protein
MILVLDNIEEKISLIAPEPPIPAKTICEILSKSIGSKSELYCSLAMSGYSS